MLLFTSVFIVIYSIVIYYYLSKKYYNIKNWKETLRYLWIIILLFFPSVANAAVVTLLLKILFSFLPLWFILIMVIIWIICLYYLRPKI